MATIFQAKCEACGARSASQPDLWLSVQTPSGSEEALPHPGEGRHLDSLGLSWEQVTRDSTLKRWAALACDGCSRVVPHDADDPRLREGWKWTDRVRLFLPTAGFLLGIILAWVSVYAWWERVLVGFGYGLIGGVGGWIVSGRLEGVHRKFSPQSVDRLKSLINCPSCCSGNLHRLAAVDGLALPCPSCGAKTYVFRLVAVS